jgi:hypothetical protein
MRVQRFCLVCLMLLVAACSPTFNWRDVSLDGAPLRAQLPCKPERAERQVPLTASGTVLRLVSCEAGGLTFALAWATVDTDERLPTVLDNWQQAGWASLRQTVGAPVGPPAGWAAWPATVARAQHLRGWQGSGLDHQGHTVMARQLYFSHGAVVYQAAVYGPSLDAMALTPFVEALRLP